MIIWGTGSLFPPCGYQIIRLGKKYLYPLNPGASFLFLNYSFPVQYVCLIKNGDSQAVYSLNGKDMAQKHAGCFPKELKNIFYLKQHPM